jgi:phospholipid-binding lipoprotein MlaA
MKPGVSDRARQCARLWLALAVCWALGGCASSGETLSEEQTAQRRLSDLSARPANAHDPLYVADPLEGTNRHIYKFNAQFDRYVFIPVVETYVDVTPKFVRDRVSAFFLNIGEVNTFINSVLQASPRKAATTLTRFAINSTIGLLGLFDVASQLHISRKNEDFGQTLGVWGIGAGPYLVLPVLGPSNVRDAVGTALDWATFSFIIPASVEGEPAYMAVQYGLQPVDTRYRIPFRYHSTGSPFEYELIRFATMKARDVEVGK